MNRKQFIESQGATCRNWNWSWSFVNHVEKFVIFGAWDANTSGAISLIFSPEWRINPKGRTSPGYEQSKEHIQLIRDNGYTLKTFPMKYAKFDEADENSLPRIADFTPTLSDKRLFELAGNWYAATDEPGEQLPAEEGEASKLYEGAINSVQVNAFERNPLARAKCLEHHGYNCAVCALNLETIYSELGKRFIHVHHVIPLSEVKKEYQIDPVKDLVPICPNCHAIVHRVRPALTVEQLRKHLSPTKR